MKNIIQALKIITLALILSFGISYVYAWTAPTQRPPSGNVSAPINTSATEQYKEGTLGIGGLIRGYANAIFDGSVGIGTTAPTQKLDVAGNIKGTGLCIGTDCKTAWPASGGATPPAGSEFLNTSATAQTKSGGLTVGQTKFSNSDVYFTDTNHNHTGIGNTAGHAAIENAANYNTLMILGRSGTPQGRSVSIWDYLTVNGGQTVTGALTATSLNTGGTVTATGNIQGQHIKFPGVGGDSGAGADTYAIYQESGPWSYPYPDLRIQYHTGIKYDAYSGYGGHRFYTGWDGSGNPAGLQMQITDKVYVSTDVCTTAGKCLSAAGGAASIDYGNCVTITHSYGLAGLSCGGVTVQANSGDCTPYTNYVMVSDSTGLRFPGACVAAVAKCCKLK